MKFSIIAAVDKNFGIGKENKIPWNLPGDLAYFQRVTTGAGKNAVIMGRNTWESVPQKHRPLKNRLNIVLTARGDLQLPTGVLKARSVDEALKLAAQNNTEEIFVIGGAQIYAQALGHAACQKIYLTKIEGAFNCDAFFPPFDTNLFRKETQSEIHTENGINYSFNIYRFTDSC